MFELRVDMEGLQRTLKMAMERGQDLQPPLRKFGAEKRQEIKDIIASGRGMPPLSPRTLENYARTGTSKVTKAGKVRASYAKRLVNEKKRLDALVAYAQKTYGRIPKGIGEKVARYEKRLAALERKVKRERAKRYSERSMGKTQAERGRGKLLGNVPNTLYAQTAKSSEHVLLVVGSRWRKDGIHNDGDAHVPKREHITLTGRDVERIKDLIAQYALRPLKRSA